MIDTLLFYKGLICLTFLIIYMEIGLQTATVVEKHFMPPNLKKRWDGLMVGDQWIGNQDSHKILLKLIWMFRQFLGLDQNQQIVLLQ